MKKFHKIFMAVAAVAGVTACTTDVTEDLGVNLNEGQTTLTLSLDDTRTQLGEKADGTYPLTWAEGDAISVNGYASKALTANEAGAASATFTFENGYGSAPYFVAYPAVEGTTNQVVFAAEQTHTSNTTFGNGAAVMYGYATDLSNVTLSHLTGVLKIGIVSGTGELTFIKEVRISTVDRKPIAGAFNVDAEGKLTATEGATEVITYKAESNAGIPVPAGTATSENPAYIHVTVPAGTYGELYVTLVSADGVMYKTITTDSSKPINAGTVREFSNNIEFVPTDEAEVFVISNYGNLCDYKEAVEKGSTLGAVLVNDIEIPAKGDVLIGKDWAPINAPEYAAEFNGNGYAIKGLYAPLFNTVAATIKGVHLEGVDIKQTLTTTQAFGTLVCTYAGSSISNCSASGSMELTGNIPDTINDQTLIAGLIGQASNGVSLSDLVNKVNITTKGTFIGGGGATLVGGVSAKFLGNAVNANNLSNEGEITLSGDARYAGVGGILGYVAASSSVPKTITFTGNTLNTGAINANNGSSGNARIGGLIGNANSYVTVVFNGPSKNDAPITVDGATSGSLYVGGYIGGLLTVSTFKINNTAENSKKASSTINGNSTETLVLGGVVGYADTTSDNNSAGKNSSIEIDGATCTNNAALTVAGTTYGNQLFIGGVLGTIQRTYYCFNNGAKFINNGKLSMNDSAESAAVIRIGGVIGYAYSKKADHLDPSTAMCYMINTGEIYFGGSAKAHLDIGGVIGRTNTTCDEVAMINTGNIKAYGKFTEKYSTGSSKNNVRVGGIIAYSANDKAMTNVQCYCNIEAYTIAKSGDSYTFTSYPLVGMICGNPSKFNSGLVNNVKIGGKIATNATVKNDAITPTWTELKATDYFDYIIGIREGITSYAGVDYLANKDAVVLPNVGE